MKDAVIFLMLFALLLLTTFMAALFWLTADFELIADNLKLMGLLGFFG